VNDVITITVMYSCTLCGNRDTPVKVPARESEMPVVEWMERTIALVGADHHRTNPRCIARQLHDLKIPISGAEWVGGPPIQ
jgi:hypothetical protein